MLNSLLKRSWFPRHLRWLNLFLFLFFIFVLFFGSVKISAFEFSSKLVMLLVWIVWWPLLYISLFFLARAWCGFFCPLALVNRWGNHLKRGKAMNVVKWGFLAYILFFLVVLWEQGSNLFLSTQTTLIFFLVFLLAAFVMGVLLPRASFCRIFCPIGTILGVFSRLSFVGVRTNKDMCKACTTKDCLKGGKAPPCPMFNHVPSISSNRDCLICTNCIKNCPLGSAKLKFVSPGRELVERVGFNLGESFFIIALLGFSVLLTKDGTGLVRLVLSSLGLSGFFLRLTDFILAIGIFFLVYIFASFLSAKISKVDVKEFLKFSGYLYLPLAFSIIAFTIVFGFLNPWLGLGGGLAFVKYVLILLGFLWSVFLLRKVIFSVALKRKFLALLPHLSFLLAVSLLWVLVLIPGPLALSEGVDDVFLVKSGEPVLVEAFSMGFSPSVLKAKEGDLIKLEIKNLDIIHSFDIDGLDVHEILEGGETLKVEFVASKKGEFEFNCAIPGHTEAGMKGRLVVE